MFPQRFSVPDLPMNSETFKPAGARRSLAVLTVATVVSITCLHPAQAQNAFSGVYNVSLIGLSLGTASVSGKLNGNDYKIEAFANLTGLASAMSGAKGSAVASGAFQNGQLAPAAYATSSSNSKETRTVRIGMQAGNVRAVDIQPPFEEQQGRVPITDAHKRNILDPLSALIMPIKQGDATNGPAVCGRSIPVFDGYTRFNVDLAYVGTRPVQAQGYKGNVVVCSARYKPIAGHRPGRKATQFMIDNKDMEVWLAPTADGRAMVPYRISVRTMVGMTVIEARRFSVGAEAPAPAAQR
jgi:hypothetical protein